MLQIFICSCLYIIKRFICIICINKVLVTKKQSQELQELQAKEELGYYKFNNSVSRYIKKSFS